MATKSAYEESLSREKIKDLYATTTSNNTGGSLTPQRMNDAVRQVELNSLLNQQQVNLNNSFLQQAISSVASGFPAAGWHFDSLMMRKRLIHCEDGPAVRLSNGKHLFYWHGTEVAEWIIMHPEKITVKRILKESNMEIRRVLVDRFGKGRFLSELGGKKQQSDKYGTLWKVERLRQSISPTFPPFARSASPITWQTREVENELFGKRKTIQFVEVKDSSTPRTYFLQVPSKIKTAKGGIAWTFGLKEEEYNPEQEA